MAFDLEPTRTPASIGNVEVILKDSLADGKSAHFDVIVNFSDGSTVHRRGDLVPHITVAQRDALINFMAGLRVQAETQLLGGG